MAVESNLRKQAEVMHGIDANMQAFGDILQQNASSQQVSKSDTFRERIKTALSGAISYQKVSVTVEHAKPNM